MRNSRISTTRGALDLRGTVGFFASAESVTGLDEENSEFSYCFFPLRVVSDGVAKMIRFSEFIGNKERHKTRAASGTTMDCFITVLRCRQQRLDQLSQRPAELSGRTTQRVFVRCRVHSWHLCRPVVVFPTASPFLPLQSLFLICGCPRLATIDKAQSTPS
jgi:hypothetical protein